MARFVVYRTEMINIWHIRIANILRMKQECFMMSDIYDALNAVDAYTMENDRC